MEVTTGEGPILAHVEREEGPTVGKYRANVEGVDAVRASAFARTFEAADFLLVDEIAPTELSLPKRRSSCSVRLWITSQIEYHRKRRNADL